MAVPTAWERRRDAMSSFKASQAALSAREQLTRAARVWTTPDLVSPALRPAPPRQAARRPTSRRADGSRVCAWTTCPPSCAFPVGSSPTVAFARTRQNLPSQDRTPSRHPRRPRQDSAIFVRSASRTPAVGSRQTGLPVRAAAARIRGDPPRWVVQGQNPFLCTTELAKDGIRFVGPDGTNRGTILFTVPSETLTATATTFTATTFTATTFTATKLTPGPAPHGLIRGGTVRRARA